MLADETRETTEAKEELTTAREKAPPKAEEKPAAKVGEKAPPKAEEKPAAKVGEKAPSKPAAGGKTAAKPGLSRDELITAIKGMTVLELSELVKALEEEFGVSAVVAAAPAAAPAGVAAEAAPAPAAEEQTEFTVVLTDFGENKINVIKAVREVTTLGLKEAKELVESAPKPVKEAISKAEAQALKEKLEGAGAKVEMR